MKVCVVGYYGDGIHKVTDGQGIKTVELYNALINKYGDKEVDKVNLYSKKVVRLSFRLLWALIRCDNIIVAVSGNGRKTVIPLLDVMNRIFRRRIFHSLIGCTTYKTLDEKPKLIPCYQRLAGNWAETNVSRKQLEDRGITNVSVVRNFKKLNILNQSDLVYSGHEPFSFCTFSRVEAPKGIPNIVRAINCVNEKHHKTVCTLDIYGKIEKEYEQDFEKLKEEFGDSIRYKGVVDFEKSVEILKNYYMLVFPTLYFTEGIPGTIIDAFSAGVPVLSAEWESCFDVLTHEVSVTYEFKNDEALINSIEYVINNPDIVNNMKEKCLKEAIKYTPEYNIPILDSYFK